MKVIAGLGNPGAEYANTPHSIGFEVVDALARSLGASWRPSSSFGGELAQGSKIPVVVGGGVKLADIPPLAQTGVDGFFVVSAVAGAPDPGKAAAELVKAWRENARKS